MKIVKSHHVCPICGLKLSCMQTLKKHVVRHEKPAMERRGFIKPVNVKHVRDKFDGLRQQCKHCGFHYRTRDGYQYGIVSGDIHVHTVANDARQCVLYNMRTGTLVIAEWEASEQ